MNEAPSPSSSSLPPLRTLSRWSRAGGVVHEIVLMALGYLASLMLLAGIFDATNPSSAIKIALAPIATFGGVLFYGLLTKFLTSRRADAARVPDARPWGTSLLLTLLASLAALAGSVVIALLVEWTTGETVQEQGRILKLLDRGVSAELIALGFAVMIAAPIAEELLFRRAFFRRLTGWVATDLAFLISALLFAAVHANVSGFVTYIWLAACFTWAYLRTGRISCAIFVHAANNAVTFVALLWGRGA